MCSFLPSVLPTLNVGSETRRTNNTNLEHPSKVGQELTILLDVPNIISSKTSPKAGSVSTKT